MKIDSPRYSTPWTVDLIILLRRNPPDFPFNKTLKHDTPLKTSRQSLPIFLNRQYFLQDRSSSCQYLHVFYSKRQSWEGKRSARGWRRRWRQQLEIVYESAVILFGCSKLQGAPKDKDSSYSEAYKDPEWPSQNQIARHVLSVSDNAKPSKQLHAADDDTSQFKAWNTWLIPPNPSKEARWNCRNARFDFCIIRLCSQLLDYSLQTSHRYYPSAVHIHPSIITSLYALPSNLKYLNAKLVTESDQLHQNTTEHKTLGHYRDVNTW